MDRESDCRMQNMAMLVAEFSNKGYKIRKKICLRINTSKGNL